MPFHNPNTGQLEYRTVTSVVGGQVRLPSRRGYTESEIQDQEMLLSLADHTDEEQQTFLRDLQEIRAAASAQRRQRREAEETPRHVPHWRRRFPELFANMSEQHALLVADTKMCDEVMLALQPYRVKGEQQADPANLMFTLGELKHMLGGLQWMHNDAGVEIFQMSDAEMVVQIPDIEDSNAGVCVRVERMVEDISKVPTHKRVRVRGMPLDGGEGDDVVVCKFVGFWFTMNKKKVLA